MTATSKSLHVASRGRLRALGVAGLVVSSLGIGGPDRCPTLPNGPVVGWGSNPSGQTLPPASVNGASGTATAIAAGGAHGCAIQSGSRAVVCWGDDAHGQATPPDSVNGVAGTADAIAAAGNLSCAIRTEDHGVVCWGADRWGNAVIPPAEVNGTLGAALAIAVGDSHVCAIQPGTGAVLCSGNQFAQLTVPDPPVPASAVAVNDVYCARFGGCFASVCTMDEGGGAVACPPGDPSPPDTVNGLAGTATSLSMGSLLVSCAIRAGSGAVACWGPIEELWPTPASVNGMAGSASAVESGVTHACATQEGSGAVVCWGDDSLGQSSPPDAVNGSAGRAIAVSAGNGFSLAIAVPACHDELDNDGDGLVDYPSDPGCATAASIRENPRCQDGVDNDGDGRLDFDGGASANGGVALGPPDPQCTSPTRNKETSSACGLGAEFILVGPLLAGARNARRARAASFARPLVG